MPNEPLIYLNGKISELQDTKISPFDRGFLWGDGVYEVTPCFGNKLYRLQDHVDRLYRSLSYVRINPSLSPSDMIMETERLLFENRDRLDTDSMYRVGHWVTRGEDSPSMKTNDAGPATLMIFFRLVDTATISRDQSKGIKLSVSSVRRNPPECIEPRAKVTSKINQILAELDVANQKALPLMLDLNGNVAENSVSNFFMVRDNALWTPPDRNILEGVTRKVVFEICERLSIPLIERNFTMYDVAQGDEFFITSSAVCAMPVSEVDSFRPKQKVPGPITKRIIEAFAVETGYKFTG
ncbi:MAG: D-alanine aminotransferase [Alphaproteobacteria bacterium MarineAlpha3_Bin7]|nr:MAG: D-alanine aminotransferase [Alphaproteobacteria bacterium MarineAlpha3_Bin7]